MQTDGVCLRVLHVLLSMDCGGMEQVVLDLVRLGVEAEQHVEVLCLERPGELAPHLRNAGVRVHCLNKPPGIQLGLRKEIAELLQSVRPNIVHTHQIGTLFYTGPPARKCGIAAVVHTEHGQEYTGRWRTRWLGRIAARHAKKFFCVSDDTAQHVLRHRIVPRRKVQVIYNGIDVDRFEGAEPYRDGVRRELGIASSALVVGTVGRLSEIKRQDVLLRSFARVKEVISDAHLLLVGDGPKRHDLTELTATLGLADHVHFVGLRVDRERYLAAMDLFALSSDSEGTPLALLEAWAAGLPVVVTAVGGLPELVEDYSTGVLVPPHHTAALSNVLVDLLADHPLRHKLGAAGKATVRSRFDRRKMAERYAHQYMTLLNKTDPVSSDMSSGVIV